MVCTLYSLFPRQLSVPAQSYISVNFASKGRVNTPSRTMSSNPANNHVAAPATGGQNIASSRGRASRGGYGRGAGRSRHPGSRKRAHDENTVAPSRSSKRTRGNRGSGREIHSSQPLQIPTLPTPRPSPAQTQRPVPIDPSQATSTSQLSSSSVIPATRPGYIRYLNRRRNADEYVYENLDEHELHHDREGLEHLEDWKFTKKDLIRVLKLHPGNGPDVYCSLDVVQLPGLDERGRVKPMYEYGKERAVVQYQALSYAVSLPC
jgi:hypothetical protein